MSTNLVTAATAQAELAVTRSTSAELAVTDSTDVAPPAREVSVSAELTVAATVTSARYATRVTWAAAFRPARADEYLFSLTDSASRATLSAVLSRTRPLTHVSSRTRATHDEVTLS